MKDTWLREQLKSYYAKLAGELLRLENPPKREVRLKPDRERFEAAAPERAARAEEIRGALPHLAFVIRMFEPGWDETTVKVTRPRAPKSGLPSQGIIGAAIDILREAQEPMTIAEIVERMAERHGLDISTVPLRQKYHTAVNNSLKKKYRDFVEKVDGKPERWRMRGRS